MRDAHALQRERQVGVHELHARGEPGVFIHWHDCFPAIRPAEAEGLGPMHPYR